MSRAIVVGSGAGGAAVARALQGPFDVTVLEAGPDFKRFTLPLSGIERLQRSRLIRFPWQARLAFASIRIRDAGGGLLAINAAGVGGTTTIATGNGLRRDGDLRALGLNLDREFAEIEREIPCTAEHRRDWRPVIRNLFAICDDLHLEPAATPKMGDYAACRHCGRCVFGCPSGVKWDSRRFVRDALAAGASLVTGCRVERLRIRGGRVVGVEARERLQPRFYPADLVVLAAGGLGTPVILERSGIHCEPTLFIDPVLCVAGPLPASNQCHEVAMPFVVQREGYILSPYFDFVSYMFNRHWRRPAADVVSMMIKLADDSAGFVSGRRIRKVLTSGDRERLRGAVAQCRQILGQLGIDDGDMFLGTLNGGHPGGMLPLTEREVASMHHDRLPANVYVADATLLPRALGNPPILTIVAVAKRVAAQCLEGLHAGRW